MFDRYDLPTSLKEATRERRQGGKPATAYHVEDNTPVGKVSAKQFLSSTTTKDVYLAKKALHHFEGKPKIFIVTSRQNVSPTVWTYSSQEKADTRIILHSLDAARKRATELYIHSPDTDVLSSQLDTTINSAGTHTSSLVWGTRSGTNGACTWGFHAFSGADVTGRFAGKGKLNCWKAVSRCSE